MLWLWEPRPQRVVLRHAGRGKLFQTMAPKIETDELLTVPQAAKLLKISATAIHKAIKRDRIPYIKLGRRFLIQRKDLIQYTQSKSLGGRPKKQG